MTGAPQLITQGGNLDTVLGIALAPDGTLWVVGAKLWRVTRFGSSYWSM